MDVVYSFIMAPQHYACITYCKGDAGFCTVACLGGKRRSQERASW